ncbi:Glycosyl transferase family 2 [Pseudobutyrivibrio sp. YE44]|uniref:glycosyltransferase family 2 protein n=1 Tax=Pseudobutyrivibrio sp. YE44 TaxID=1520802 RepID=UPI000887F839|nr:glycosyltransferase family A protein [Pseudobutyrivibrio sp. YE44]SDB39014.1 Glycosyl transferase family 2 [Pseudobutyrivibrio sp. YE44]
MAKDKLITIYTSTYNRATLLPRVYESLKRQTSYNFIWQVIDDGSTDDTKIVVEKWKSETKEFEIRYYYKENGGIHTARDAAYKLCDTELILGVDSDDWLMDDAVEKIENIWNENDDKNVIGIFAKTTLESGKIACESFPESLKKATCQDFLYKYKLQSDTVNVFKTDEMKKLVDAPKFDGENLIGEGYKMIQLPEKPFLVRDIPIVVVEYQENGYSMGAHEAVFRNPKGFREDYKMHMVKARYFKPKMRGYLGYISCSFILHDYKYIKKSPKKIMTVLLTPLGVLSYLYLLSRTHKKTKAARISEK